MQIPLAPPCDYAPLFRLERARLLELLRGLGPDDWHRSTPCQRWDVLGLVVHLVGDDLSLVAWQRDGYHGTPAPDGLDEAGFIDWLDRLQLEWVHAARRLSPSVAIELLDWIGAQVAATIAAGDPVAATASVTWANREPVPVWLDHARELTERWIHRQQLLQALGHPSDLRADLATPVLDALRWAYPLRLGDHPRPSGASVMIEVTGGELACTWALVSDGTDWEFAALTVAPVATMTLTAEQAWRLLSNNYDRARHGDIELAGDPGLTTALVRTRAIIGTPK